MYVCKYTCFKNWKKYNLEKLHFCLFKRGSIPEYTYYLTKICFFWKEGLPSEYLAIFKTN